MPMLTASNIIREIKNLNKNNNYNYINSKTKGLIQIIGFDSPEGPIKIKRWDPSKNEIPDNKKVESISSELIWRVANAFIPGVPINIDRVLGASYNTRSVLEALLAHCPNFFYCYPGRIEDTGGTSKIKKGHKHLVWLPNSTHKIGVLAEHKTTLAISEIPNSNVFYDALTIPKDDKTLELGDEVRRRHSQIQIALYFIGKQLKFSTWIANNDKGIIYKNKKLGEYEGVIKSLGESTVIRGSEDAIRAALLIDCIWFKNGKLMPAVMEIEQSTGVTSGLSRMKNFQDHAPAIKTRYVIVAPDEDKEKVLREIRKEQFKSLNAQYFPYSAVEELYDLCERRKLRGVNDEFLDCYMETIN